MFSEAIKIQSERPPNVHLGGKEQTAAGSVALGGFYELSLTTRSQNPGEDGLIYRTVIPSSPCSEDLVEGSGDSVLRSGTLIYKKIVKLHIKFRK